MLRLSFSWNLLSSYRYYVTALTDANYIFVTRDPTVKNRGAPDPYPDPDTAGYPVDLVDPVRIRPDPKSMDPVRIRIRPDPTWDPTGSES